MLHSKNQINAMELHQMKTYTFHNDPGHGWLAVKREELVKLGILEEISSYSYQKGKTVYLEEDCDYATFYNAYKAKYGIEPQTKSSYQERSPIRSYYRFSI